MNSLLARRLALAALVTAGAALGPIVAAERSSSTMATAGTKFLASLTPEQRQQAAFAFGDERLHWHFIPTEMFPRRGLLIRDMTAPQRSLAHDLLKSGLSQRGYMTASQIMDLESVLGAMERAEREGTWTMLRRIACDRCGLPESCP